MKHILIFKFPYASLFGGGEQHTLTLVEELSKKGFAFYLVSSCRVLLKEFRARHWHAKKLWVGMEPVSKGAIALWPFVLPYTIIALTATVAYYRLFRGVRILYCLSLTEKIVATLPAKLLGMQVVWIEHVTVERWLTQNPLKVLYWLYSRLVTIVAISNVVRQQLIERIHVPARSVMVIYCGIDLRRFSMRDYRWEDRARYNVGCVARLEREKGIEFLIQAIKIVREFVPYARLIIVGEGGEKRKLVWLSERIGLKEHIQWVGYQREVEKWYRYFDAYALPSVIRESFGITLVEAMASGVPVVASRIGGTPEIIEHKVTGLLAEPGSSQDLADQLLYLYNNRSETHDMVLRARQRAEQHFSIERMVRDYYLLFRK